MDRPSRPEPGLLAWLCGLLAAVGKAEAEPARRRNPLAWVGFGVVLGFAGVWLAVRKPPPPPPKGETPSWQPSESSEAGWQAARLPPAAPPVLEPLREPPVRREPEPEAPPSDPGLVTGLIDLIAADPAAYFVGQTLLKYPRVFRAWALDPERVRRQLDNPIVKTILRHPTAVSALASRASVRKAILSSPAMQNPSSVQAVFDGPMFERLMSLPGSYNVLADKKTADAVLNDPGVREWLEKNPEAKLKIQAAVMAAQARGPMK